MVPPTRPPAFSQFLVPPLSRRPVLSRGQLEYVNLLFFSPRDLCLPSSSSSPFIFFLLVFFLPNAVFFPLRDYPPLFRRYAADPFKKMYFLNPPPLIADRVLPLPHPASGSVLSPLSVCRFLDQSGTVPFSFPSNDNRPLVVTGLSSPVTIHLENV